MRNLNVRWLGKLPYQEAYDLQRGIHKDVSNDNSSDDYLLLLEHDKVITVGRSAKAENLLVEKNELLTKKVEYVETDRGGDITYHGEGQIVGYPIIRLTDPKKVIPYVRDLESVIIETLKKYSIDSFTKEDE